MNGMQLWRTEMSRMVKVSTNVGPLVKTMSQKQQEKCFKKERVKMASDPTLRIIRPLVF